MLIIAMFYVINSEIIAADLNSAEDKCIDTEAYNAYQNVMWISAETDMRQLLENNFVPRSEFDSGGLIILI